MTTTAPAPIKTTTEIDDNPQYAGTWHEHTINGRLRITVSEYDGFNSRTFTDADTGKFLIGWLYQPGPLGESNTYKTEAGLNRAIANRTR